MDGSLPRALGGYEIQGLADVELYLKRNNDLMGFLTSLPARISEVNSEASVRLEFYHDIEEHWEKLFVVVDTRIDDMAELDVLEDDLYALLFQPRAEFLSGRIVLSVE